MTDVDLFQKDYTSEIRKNLELLQELYVKNFIIYTKTQTNYGKQVVKNCRNAVKLFDEIIKNNDALFDTKLFSDEISEFEDHLNKFNGNDSFLRAQYEAVQVYFHIHLKQMDAGYCFEHNINLHYCHKCQVKHGVKKEGDKDF